LGRRKEFFMKKRGEVNRQKPSEKRNLFHRENTKGRVGKRPIDYTGCPH